MTIPELAAQLRKRWFLVSLVLLIAGGMFVGARVPQPYFAPIARLIQPTITTAVILFLMSFSLESRQIQKALRSPLSVVWASFVNMGLLPPLAWVAMSVQQSVDFEYGLLIAGSVPCTLAAASVWTRKAGGNDAISLLVTLLTNIACFLVTPFWLNRASRGQEISLDSTSMVFELGVYVLLPTMCGQAARFLEPLRNFADRRKHALGVIAQMLILAVILRTALNAGVQVDKFGAGLSGSALLLVWGTCALIHCVGLLVGYVGARQLRLSVADQIAIAFASSQKTLPIGILLATNEKIFGNPNLLGPGRGVPFAVFPMLIYHATQLFIDTLVADRFAARNEKTKPAENSAGQPAAVDTKP